MTLPRREPQTTVPNPDVSLSSSCLGVGRFKASFSGSLLAEPGGAEC
jgi:hypothetical protein